MYSYLPSKKFSLILISVILAIGIIYSPNLFKKNPPKETALTLVSNTDSEQKIKSIDTDNDGLKDWEETLRGTKIDNPDSDDDGTNDGDEITVNRDPLKANTAKEGQAPNDKLSEEVIRAIKADEENSRPLTTTEKVSRELLIQFINTQKLDTPLTEAERQAIVDKALSYLPEFTFKIYTAKDIIISKAKDELTLRNYANSIAEIILTNLKNETESVDAIIADTDKIKSDETLNAEIEIIFKRFDPLIVKNQKTVSDLLKITVPEIFVAEHLQLLNAVEEIYEKLGLMQKSAEDFVVFVILKSQYYLSVQNLANSLQKIAEVLAIAKVTFSTKKDYGYQLFNVIMTIP